MSPSSDIETLFGHFGGNAGDYQEIGRDNEARTARTRWPLLVTLDLTQPTIPAVAQRRDPQAAPGGESAPAQAEDGAHAVKPADTAAPRETREARSKAPLFARAHRRNVPPVPNVAIPDVQHGAERFSALPDMAGEAGPDTAQAAGVAASSGAAAAVTPAAPVFIPPVVAPIAAAHSAVAPGFAAGFAPVMAPVMPAAIPPAFSAQASRPLATPAMPTFAPRPAMPAGAPSWASATATQAAPAAPAAPAALAQQPAVNPPPSILGKLFAPAVASTPPAQASGSENAALHSVFDRLRGTASPSGNTAAAPAPHSWLVNGPRRS